MEFIQVTFSRHGTRKILCDTSLALARSSPTRRYTGYISTYYYLNSAIILAEVLFQSFHYPPVGGSVPIITSATVGSPKPALLCL